MSTVAEIEKLLAEVKGIVEKHKKVDEMTGKNFNIFKVCEIHDKEVLLCRFIYQLINPKGLHNQGDVFLRKFITDVLGGVISDSENKDSGKLIIAESELSKVRVYKEFVIKNDRRIDLLIETNEHTIPIEVKIFAGDQENQCNDYLEYSKKSKLYYLTLYGDPPSDNSYKYEVERNDKENYDDECYRKIEEIKNKISCISFREHIIIWIEDCIKDINIIDKKQIVDNLIQFLNVVRGLCNMGDNDLNIDLKRVFKEPKDFQAYLEMKKSEVIIRIDLLTSFLNGIKEKFNNSKYEIFEVYNKDFEEKIVNTCEGRRIGEDTSNVSGFGLKTKMENVNGEVIDLCVCVEVLKNYDTYYGVFIIDDKYATSVNSKIILDKLGIVGESNAKFPFWKKLMVDDESPNFVIPNGAFAKLIDKNTLGQFIEDIEQMLKELIDKVEGINS